MITICGGFESVPAGVYQPCIFKALEECETSKGKAYRWRFETPDNKPITELSDREHPPTERNKTGRFLAALAGKPPVVGTAVEPNDFVGRKYLVVVSPKAGATNGQTGIATFSPLA
jgi:hypothetical protein